MYMLERILKLNFFKDNSKFFKLNIKKKTYF